MPLICLVTTGWRLYVNFNVVFQTTSFYPCSWDFLLPDIVFDLLWHGSDCCNPMHQIPELSMTMSRTDLGHGVSWSNRISIHSEC